MMSDTLIPGKDYKIGISFLTTDLIYENFSLPESFERGWKQTSRSVNLFIGAFVQIFKGNTSIKETFGGPIMIAKSANQQAKMGLPNFVGFMALLSISLALINIFPFPALDGGHLLIIIIEGIARREIPVKAKMIIQQTGFVILLLFMAYIIYNDFMR